MANVDIIMPSRSQDTLPVVRKLSAADLGHVLAAGLDDFWAMPTHVVFICAIYPMVGILLAWTSFDPSSMALLYPLVAGFILLGPLSAIWLFELSRRRELGKDVSWRHAFDIFNSPSLPAIAMLGLLLLALFAAWIAFAQTLYDAYFGGQKIGSASEFVQLIFNTSRGHTLIAVGCAVGLPFAVLAAILSVISFPLLLDRQISASAAILTSVNVVLRNPVVMAGWGLIVAFCLALGALPFFIGLAVITPILGHSTWHLYRAAVEPDPNPRPDFHPPRRARRYAADFPASIFFPAAWEDSQED